VGLLTPLLHTWGAVKGNTLTPPGEKKNFFPEILYKKGMVFDELNTMPF
jgi:hypothetical protein